FAEPYKRTRDTIRFLRAALAGEKVDETFDTFTVRGFRLGRPLAPEAVPPILVAGLRPGMLRLAGREGDGAIINWLSADDVRPVRGQRGDDPGAGGPAPRRRPRRPAPGRPRPRSIAFS